VIDPTGASTKSVVKMSAITKWKPIAMFNENYLYAIEMQPTVYKK
jgi:hypothetical protein